MLLVVERRPRAGPSVASAQEIARRPANELRGPVLSPLSYGVHGESPRSHNWKTNLMFAQLRNVNNPLERIKLYKTPFEYVQTHIPRVYSYTKSF